MERKGDGFQDVSIELVGKAREIADRLERHLVALILGPPSERGGDRDGANRLIRAGADRVVSVEDPRLDRYDTLAVTAILERELRTADPAIVLLGATRNGQDLAGRLAVRLRTGLTAHCTGLDVDASGLLVGWVPGFGGGIEAAITCPKRRPQMATVRPGVFPSPTPKERTGVVTRVYPGLAEKDLGSKRVAFVPKGATVDITRSPVLVIGGRGTGGDFSRLNELAKLLGGEVGATRVASDAGWVDRERMIGQTGVSTRPRLAIVLGASGAVQFTVGIDGAECVVAVNQDPDAPIFGNADLGIVGELGPVVDRLLAKLRGG